MPQPHAEFRFVGQEAIVFDTPYVFTAFGQLNAIPEADARRFVLDGVQLIPASTFDSIGFTPKQIADHPSTITHDTAPAEFRLKKKRALELLDQYRESLKTASSPVVPAPRELPLATTTESPEVTHAQ